MLQFRPGMTGCDKNLPGLTHIGNLDEWGGGRVREQQVLRLQVTLRGEGGITCSMKQRHKAHEWL